MNALGTIYFSACGAIAIMSALGTVASRTPIRAALCLLAHILSLAGLYISLHAHLLAAVQLIVYAGAVVVLFVFVIMLIGPTEEPKGPIAKGGASRVLSICLMFGVMLSIAAGVGGIMPEAPVITGCPNAEPECAQFGGVDAVASVLYRQAAVPFELVSILLLVAILGAIAVARGRTLGEKKRDAKRLSATRASELAAQATASSGQ